MENIICPHCGEKFSLDNDNANRIFSQLRDGAFKDELQRRLELEKANLNAIFQEKLNSQKTKLNSEFSEQISNLKNDLQISQNQNANLQTQMNTNIENEKLKITQQNADEIANLRQEIANLKNRLSSELNLKSVEIQNAKLQIQNELNAEFSEEKTALNAKIESLKNEVNLKQSEVDFYKDFKAKQSVKLLGESLEQHCLVEFNKVRSMLPMSVYFEKDNEIIDGTKGDFIYRELDESGVEVISIMFEMKNEADLSANKKKNEDFLEKLDKDRKKKNCEFAVLVSVLEPDNEYYNAGIVDISHRYEKMFVIRPQFFIPLISILRSANLSSFKAKKELEFEKNRNIDITNFEEKLIKFRDSFAKNCDNAAKNFDGAIEEIDKAIKNLQDTKERLIKSMKWLDTANRKSSEDLTIKKLTYKNPTMKKAFEKLNSNEQNSQNLLENSSQSENLE
ncbi:MAG: DUF2130 domain-containing protein [Campylobacter sp.]|nr:DUF2130 domain-containing protein [Campylobacter sp.]